MTFRSMLFGILVLTIGVSAALAAETTASAGPNTCFVDGATGSDANSCDAPAHAKRTIQAGVNAVATGGTVVVAPGLYNDAVIISRAMTVKGVQSGAAGYGRLGGHCDAIGETVVRPLSGLAAPVPANAFTVTSQQVVINGFCIINAIAGLYTPPGVPLNVGLLSTVVVESEMGFDIGDCRNCVLSRDVFMNLGSITSDIRNRIGKSSSLDLSDSYFWFLSSTALLLDGDATAPGFDHSHATVLRNSFFSVGTAMVVTHVTQAQFLENDVYAEESGIEFWSATHVVVRHNLLNADVMAVPGHGVALAIGGVGGPAHHLTIQDNSISGRLYGISVGPTYTGNLNLKKNWWGSVTGPSPVSVNPLSDGSGAAIQDVGPSGRLTYQPWYCTGASSAPIGGPGFIPTGPLCP